MWALNRKSAYRKRSRFQPAMKDHKLERRMLIQKESNTLGKLLAAKSPYEESTLCP